MRRSSWVLVLALLLVLPACRDDDEPSADVPYVDTGLDDDPRPNVVVIYTDDMALSDLVAMPRTQRLLGDAGVEFARHVTPFPLCCPDRVTLLTGQYAHNHGVLGNGGDEFPEGGYEGFDTDASTVATWVDDAGYQTAYVGKYLNGYAPGGNRGEAPPGWDVWSAAVGNDYRRVTAYEGAENEDGVTIARRTQHPNTYNATWVTEEAEQVIADRVPDGAPLLMYVGYHAPHVGTPVEPDDPGTVDGLTIGTPVPARADVDAFADTPLPDDPSIDERVVSDKPAQVADRPPLTEAQLAGLTELHQQRLESLVAVDRGVARIVTQLRQSGELDDTVVVFTSDNGYVLGHHRIPQGKVRPYEPALRVPMLVRGPGFPAGTTAEQLTGAQDVVPTILDLANAQPVGRQVDGTSLVPLAEEASYQTGRDLVIEAGPRVVGGPMAWTGLRTDQFTYVEYANGERELYDLVDDPHQLQNLVDDPAYAVWVKRLARQLDVMRDCVGPDCLTPTAW